MVDFAFKTFNLIETSPVATKHQPLEDYDLIDREPSQTFLIEYSALHHF